MQRINNGHSQCRIVLTGGPGGGKTTAADLYRREIGDRVVIVPEAATLLYGGGFPRVGQPDVRRPTQHAIYHVQVNLEEAQAAQYPNRVLICDRGTIDGAAYWPESPDAFFASLDTSIEQELMRYDAVIFFETAAVGGISIEGGNPVRIESIEQALSLDQRLRGLWSQNLYFVFVPHNMSFMKKIGTGLDALSSIIAEYNHQSAQQDRTVAAPPLTEP